MKRLPLAIALLSTSACFDPAEPSTSITAGLQPVTDTDPTPEPTTGASEGSADGVSSDDAPAPATCSDGAQGEDETDVDCGGSCPPCDNGQACMVPADCSSEVCESEVCVSPSCGNGSIEDGETCDDAGESATCNVDCSAVACGDGVLNVTAGEACDEGGNTATCDADCTAVACGDGSLNPAAGEACDDAGETAACDLDCTAASCGDGTINGAAGEECDGGPAGECGPDCLFAGCLPDPVALAMAACMAAYPSCDIVGGGVVGYGGGSCTGCNCGLPADPWRFYCTMTSDASNYNCSACTVGEILGAHNPCSCDPGTSPVLGTFCM